MTMSDAAPIVQRAGTAKRSGGRRTLKWVAILIGATVVLLIVISRAAPVRHYIKAASAYQSSGLILPDGMSQTDVADRTCKHLQARGLDGAALQLSAHDGVDFELARKFVQALSDKGYC
jgi:hypothetical protein